MIFQNQDGRLEKAYKEIDEGKISLLSFDIFDTLLFRKLPIPIDLFILLGELFQEEGLLIPAVSAEVFPLMRIQAESTARFRKEEETESTEVNLKEIYWSLHGIFKHINVEDLVKGKRGIINESDVDELVEMEIALENKFTVIDQNILSLMHYAHQKGIPVILVSNTFFEEHYLRMFLDKNSFPGMPSVLSMISQIYASCDYGVSKQDGLFEKVLLDWKIPPEKMMHIGDQPIYDVKAASALNIRTTYYSRFSPELAAVIEREWNSHDIRARKRQLDSNEGDFGLTTLRSQLENTLSLKKLSSKDQFFWKYGATIYGPILAGFVHWIYARCEEMQESEVYCLMREGRLYASLIQESAPYFNHKIQTKELWGSRPYLRLACISQATPEELFSLIYQNPATPYTIREFCDLLGIDVAQDKLFSRYAHVRMESEPKEVEILREDLIAHLTSNSSYKERIIQKAQERRRRFLKYLNGVVDLSTKKNLTLLDIGWAGTIQSAMQTVLNLEGYKIQLQGLYLGTEANTAHTLINGRIREGYLIKAGYPTDITGVLKRFGRLVIEQTASADCAPMIDISEQGKIILGDFTNSPEQRAQAVKIHEGIKACCHLIGLQCKAKIVSWNPFSEALSEQLRQILMRASGYLTIQEGEIFGQWTHDISSGRSESLLLANDSYSEKFAVDMFPNSILKNSQIVLPAAYLAKGSQNFALGLQLIRQGLLPASCFLSSDVIPLRIFMDCGSGFKNDPDHVFDLQSNPNRSFFAWKRLWSIHKSIKKIRLEIDQEGPFILHMRSFRGLNTYLNGDTKEKVFFESEDASEDLTIMVSASEAIAPHVFYCEKGPAIFSYSILEEGAYSVEIKFCFEIQVL